LLPAVTGPVLAADFIAKWRAAELTERAAAHSHFRDLCDLLGEQAPSDADPKGEWYAFEKGATKTTGGEGWADVWKRGCFGWEYKSYCKISFCPPKEREYVARRVHCQMARDHAHRAVGRSGAFSRSVRPARSSEAG
jgi:hypothetical protein